MQTTNSFKTKLYVISMEGKIITLLKFHISILPLQYRLHHNVMKTEKTTNY